MTRFIKIISVVVVIMLLGFIAWSQTDYSESDIGRYQLFQGNYKVFYSKEDGGRTSERKGIFKIDTKTGYVWEYVCGVDKEGKLNQGWAETWESNEK